MATIEQIRDAIIRQEGHPAEYTNPGSLRDAPWFTGGPPLVAPQVKPGTYVSRRVYANGDALQYAFLGASGLFWQPRSRDEGIAGLDHVIALHRAQGNTLRDFIAGHPGVYGGFAPGADRNNPGVYVANVASWTGLDPDRPMWSQADPFVLPT